MSIITVNGVISKDELGITSTHEHIIFDGSCQLSCLNESINKALFDQKVSIENLGAIRRNPLSVADNHVLDDSKLAKEELSLFKKAGGNTIVDVTCRGIGRDPKILKDISGNLGINIIAGCGYYCCNSHPDDMNERSAEDIASEILTEINIGIDNTGIRAGVIGEVGLSEEIDPDEKKVLIASAIASAESGTGIIVHTFDWNRNNGFPAGIEAVDILVKNGADPGKIAIGHVDVAMNINIDYLNEILGRGAYLAFDNFGHEFYINRNDREFLPGPFATDLERAKTIKTLADAGYISRIIIGSDICHKSQLHKYGGWGYDHLLTNIIPMLLDVGMTYEQIMILLKENPKQFLDNGK